MWGGGSKLNGLIQTRMIPCNALSDIAVHIVLFLKYFECNPAIYSLETNAKYLQNILSLTKKPKYQKKINNLFCLTLILYKSWSKLVSQTVPRDTYQIHWTQIILLHINVWVAYMHHEMVGPSTRLAELTNEWCTFSIRIIHIIIKSWTLMYCRKK